MKKMSKRLALVMVLVLVFSINTPALAVAADGVSLQSVTKDWFEVAVGGVLEAHRVALFNELMATKSIEEYNAVLEKNRVFADYCLTTFDGEKKEQLIAHYIELSAVTGEGFVSSSNECEGVALTVNVPNGAFPNDTVNTVTAVYDSETIETIVKAFETEENTVPMAGYDISFAYSYLDVTNEIQPAVSVPLTFEVPTELVEGAEMLQVFHMAEKEDGSFVAEKVGEAIEVNSESATQILKVDAIEFSVYVVASVGAPANDGVETTTVLMTVGEQLVLYTNRTGGEWSVRSGSSAQIVGNDTSSQYITIEAVSNGTTQFGYSYKGWFGGTNYDTITVIVGEKAGYTVTFMQEAGSSTSYTLTTDRYGNFVLPTIEETGFVKEGWQFAGWSTDSTGTGSNYSAGIERQVSSNNTTFYAIWFDPSSEGSQTAYFFIRLDGVIPYEPDNNKVSSDYRPNTGGWDSYHQELNQGKLKNAVAINNNLTAVAANIAEAPTDAEIQTMLRTSSNSNVTFTPGQQVVQWYVIKKDGNYWHVDGVIKDVDKFFLIYHPNGGDSNVPAASQHAEGEVVSINYSTIPNRAGYEFIGWDTNPNATTPTYTYSTKSPANLVGNMPSSNEDLYAIWRPLNTTPYYVEHWLVQGDGQVVQHTVPVARDAKYGETDSIITISTTNVAEYARTIAGYEIDLSNANSVLTGTVIADDENPLVLKLYYNEQQVEINYVALPVGDQTAGMVTPEKEAVYAASGTATGSTATVNDSYTFVGWFDNEEATGTPLSTDLHFTPAKSADNVYVAATYYAKFAEQQATIHYVAVGPNNQLLADQTIGYVDPTSEVLDILSGEAAGSTATLADSENYVFVGWFSNANCTDNVGTDATYVPKQPTNVDDAGATVVTPWLDGTTFYAKFDEVPAKITYEVVGPTGCGTVDLQDTDTATAPAAKVEEEFGRVTGTAVGATAAPTSNVYKFVGWYSDEAYENLISTEATYEPQQPSHEDSVTGEKVLDPWPTSSVYYAKFEYNLTSLTIVKDGYAETASIDPNQTFIFKVTGGDLGDGIMVSIDGDGSKTISGLTVGVEYTVTEMESWSWRYDSDSSKSITLQPTGNTVTINNTRKHVYWLDGNAVSETNVYGN